MGVLPVAMRSLAGTSLTEGNPEEFKWEDIQSMVHSSEAKVIVLLGGIVIFALNHNVGCMFWTWMYDLDAEFPAGRPEQAASDGSHN